MRVPLFWQVLPVHCLILSFFILPVWKHQAAVADSRATETRLQQDLATKRLATSQIKGQPTRLLLPRLGIDLPVVAGRYDFNSASWSVTNSTANYAQNTKEPNNKQDKTLIYGHWTPAVFGPTSDLKLGDNAYIYTDNGHVLKYKYESNQIVKPTDTAVFEKFKGRPGLVLLTCQGVWAQERRLMFFNLEAAL